MAQASTDLEKFLLWFSKLEEVPLQTRRDFFSHVMEVGGLDEKAQKFIDDTMSLLEKKDQKKLLVLQQKIALFDDALAIQSVQKLSLKERIVEGVTTWMNEKVGNFKTMFRVKEASIMKQAESAEDLENMAQIARLKAAL